jgi:hypothetical protein
LLAAAAGLPAQSVANAAVTAKTRSERAQAGQRFSTIGEGMYYRDSAGRTRTEWIRPRKDGTKRHVIEIASRHSSGDIVTFMLDPEKLTAVRHQTTPPRPTDPGSPNRWHVRHFQDLGKRTIEGHTCQGLRYGPAPVATHYDVWRCEAIQLDVVRTYYKAEGIVDQDVLYDVRLGEPAPVLFQVPGNYRIVDHSDETAHAHPKCNACTKPQPAKVTAVSAGRTSRQP